MNLLNFPDGIFREFVHIPDMDSRCTLRGAMERLRAQQAYR